MGSWPPERFGIDGNTSQLAHWWYQNGWGGPELLGGNLKYGVSAVSWAAGRLDIFGVDSNTNQPVHWWWDNGWGGPDTTLAGTLQSSPSAVSWVLTGWISSELTAIRISFSTGGMMLATLAGVDQSYLVETWVLRPVRSRGPLVVWTSLRGISIACFSTGGIKMAGVDQKHLQGIPWLKVASWDPSQVRYRGGLAVWTSLQPTPVTTSHTIGGGKTAGVDQSY